MSYKNTTLTVIQFYTVLFKNHLGPSIINLTLYKTWNFFLIRNIAQNCNFSTSEIEIMILVILVLSINLKL